MTIKNELGFTFKTLIIAVVMLFAMVAASVLTLPTESMGDSTGQQDSVMLLLFVINAVNALLIALVIRHSRWRGIPLIAGLLVAFYGVQTFIGQIEAVVFLTPLGEKWGAGSVPAITMPLDFIRSQFIIGAAQAIVAVPLATFLLGKFGTDKTGENQKLFPQFGFPQWLLKLAAVIVLYEILYFGFGYFVAWKNPAVYIDRHPVGNHIDLVAAGKDGCCNGVAQQRVKEPPFFAEQGKNPIRQHRVRDLGQHEAFDAPERIGEPLKHPAGRRRNVNRQPFFVHRPQQVGQFRHGAASDRDGRVSPGAPEGGLHPAMLFFGDHDRIKPAVADLHGEAAELADGIARAFKERPMFLYQVPCAEFAAGLFVANDHKQHIPRWRTFFRNTQQSGQHHGDPALHV